VKTGDGHFGGSEPNRSREQRLRCAKGMIIHTSKGGAGRQAPSPARHFTRRLSSHLLFSISESVSVSLLLATRLMDLGFLA
jgi:hypothetical protein